jgi:hypothetical protein
MEDLIENLSKLQLEEGLKEATEDEMDAQDSSTIVHGIDTFRGHDSAATSDPENIAVSSTPRSDVIDDGTTNKR